MNILLTNDDGFDFVGIRLLKEKLKKYGNVIICAPKGPMSAKSTSKIFGVPLKLVEEEKDVFSFSGTPADCVAFGCTSMDTKFDLVVSGCNNGVNIANDILYSGTIGACLEALTYGIPALAISCESNYEIVEENFDKVFDFILKNKLLNKEYLLNVNFPKGKVVKDIQIGRVYYRKDYNFFEYKDGGYYAKRNIETVFTEEDTDCYQIDNDIVSIVPLNRGLCNDELYRSLKERKLEK